MSVVVTDAGVNWAVADAMNWIELNDTGEASAIKSNAPVFAPAVAATAVVAPANKGTGSQLDIVTPAPPPVVFTLAVTMLPALVPNVTPLAFENAKVWKVKLPFEAEAA